MAAPVQVYDELMDQIEKRVRAKLAAQPAWSTGTADMRQRLFESAVEWEREDLRALATRADTESGGEKAVLLRLLVDLVDPELRKRIIGARKRKG